MTLLAETTNVNLWPMIATIASLFASGMFGLVIYNLQSLKASMTEIVNRQNTQADDIKRLVERKNICNQDYVGKVEYIRSSNGLEDGLKKLIENTATLAGTMKVFEQMPAICGSIARDVVREMKNNG